ncbi:group II intron reverse transcriptase/maturase [Methylomonas sp. AM2-LC]|uniref:group II intron reverse transcriptase/maturase n=1 Tax=Methylomonas sp. AM2-LC TaxID=3153301 RepID=UPI003266F774
MLNEDVMERVLNRDNLQEAYKRVKANKGSAGVDGMTVEDFADHAGKHWPVIAEKLKAGTYQSGAIRGIAIPKPQGGERVLGIPNVQDRVIQQAVSQVLSPIFEAEFSEHSYGYRPQRSAHDAVRAASRYVMEGKTWVVDIDICAFFDEVNHDKLMAKIGQKVRDKRVLKLIGNYLRAPMERDGQRIKRSQGTPQGGPLSPLLANIYLDDLDKELESRGLSFCRYADDLVIFVKSERSGERILASLTEWIAKHLKLRVNPNKSGTGRPWQGKFLGFRINSDGSIKLAKASLEKLKDQVRNYWNNQNRQALEERIKEWQQYIRGWYAYYGACIKYPITRALEGWIRRHMRKYFWQRWHNKRGRINALKRLKAKPYHLRQTTVSVGAWRMARSPMLSTVLNNARLKRWGLWLPSDFVTR